MVASSLSTPLPLLATLLTLAALFGLANARLFRLPHTAGLVVLGLAASAAVAALDAAAPTLSLDPSTRAILAAIDFRALLLDGFLSALLFAGAIHVDLAEVAQKKLAVAVLATVGVLISTAVAGLATFAAARALGQTLPLIWALTFGALISPTDPVAVLALLKTVRVPASLHAKLAAEALFNDGVGIVLFTVILGMATGSGDGPGLPEAAKLFLLEAVGGVALGLATGYAATHLMALTDDHVLELMITLALVAGAYAIAQALGVSGPIAEVVAGLLIGNHGAKFAMSEAARKTIFEFWELVEELLNSVLFLLIGLEVLLIGGSRAGIALALTAIPIVLAARWLSVALPLAALSRWDTFSRGAVPILTWAGLRGGISVALALSLPETPYKAAILTASYAVVIFTVVAQGVTMPALVRRYYPGAIAIKPPPARSDT